MYRLYRLEPNWTFNTITSINQCKLIIRYDNIFELYIIMYQRHFSFIFFALVGLKYMRYLIFNILRKTIIHSPSKILQFIKQNSRIV